MAQPPRARQQFAPATPTNGRFCLDRAFRGLPVHTFVLVGSALDDDGFRSGDTIIVLAGGEPADGEYVECLFPDGARELRQFRDRGQRGRYLVTKNKAHRPYRIDPAKPPVIVGVLVGLVRLTDRVRADAYTPG